MQLWTIATLIELAEASWFSRLGVKDTETAIVVSSWPEAVEHCKAHQWELLRKEALARYFDCVAVRSEQCVKLWDDVLRDVRIVTEPLVTRKIAAVVREHNLPQIFEAQVRSDIDALCMESEFGDVFPPSFFMASGYWYLNGHFPCGWRGEFPPKGQRFVY